jgi:hypothetical protein
LISQASRLKRLIRAGEVVFNSHDLSPWPIARGSSQSRVVRSNQREVARDGGRPRGTLHCRKGPGRGKVYPLSSCHTRVLPNAIW